MSILTITVIILAVIAALLLVGLAMAVRIVKQYEQGVLFPSNPDRAVPSSNRARGTLALGREAAAVLAGRSRTQ